MKRSWLLALLFLLPSLAHAGGRDGAGTMSLSYPSFVPGATISSSQVNTDLSQITSELTNSWPRDGQAAPTASMPMNGYKLTGLGNGVASGDSVNYGQLTAATTGLITASSTNTLTNKTFDTAGTGNVFKINGQAISAVSGNTTKVATISGALTNGNVVSIDGNGNLVDSGTVPGAGGGSGTVNSGTANHLAYYASSTTAVSSNVNLSISTGALTIGQAASVQGSLLLAGSVASSTTLAAPTTGGGTITLPAGTDTLTGKATTDTLTNKTLDTAGTGNVLKINGTTVSDKTGTGKVVLDTSPTIATAALGSSTATTQSAGDNSTKLATTAYVDRAGGMQLLATVNASNAASVTFNATYITATYNKYVLEYDGATTGVSSGQVGGTLELQVSTNNGSTWQTTSYVASSGGATSFINIGPMTCNDGNGNCVSGSSGEGSISFSNPSGSLRKNFIVHSTFYDNGNGNVADLNNSATYQGSSFNAIKVFLTSGNMTGNFHLYGLSGN